MNESRQIWVGRDGQRYGPYDEATLRAWIAEGKVEATALGWYEGMAEWQPLNVILGISVPPPLARSTVPPFPGMPGAMPYADFPAPPDLHWAILLVVDVFAGGLLGLVWQFVQASWVKKLDPDNRAMLWLVISLCIVPVAWFAMIGVALNVSGSGPTPDIGAVAGMMTYFGLIFVLLLATLVLRYVAFFAMARSLREKLPAYGLVPSIGGVTLFFFTHYYMQGQLSWVARWRTTGRVDPPPPKAVFWWLLLGWFGLVMLFFLLVGLVVLGHVAG